MKLLRVLSIAFIILPYTAWAGGSSGGTPPMMQLEAMAVSERVIPISEFGQLSGKLNGGLKTRLEAPMMLKRSRITFSESNVMENIGATGLLVNVAPSDFKVLANELENGGTVSYHDAETEVSAVNYDTSTVILKMVEDPGVVLVVQPDDAP